MSQNSDSLSVEELLKQFGNSTQGIKEHQQFEINTIINSQQCLLQLNTTINMLKKQNLELKCINNLLTQKLNKCNNEIRVLKQKLAEYENNNN